MQKFRPEREVLEEIKKLIHTHFGETGQGLHVEVKGDRVYLWGTVDNLAEKDFIGQRIRRLDGVRELDNGLTVATDGNITDKDIQAEVEARFTKSSDSEIEKLGCRVSKGNVTLLGHVEAQSTERLAKRLASQVRGVKDVRSAIQFREKWVDDATLVNRVEEALVTSPWVNAHEIKTTAFNGLVTLTGMVDSQEEMEWAADVAYQVPGVKAVVSKIFTRHRSQGEDLWLTEELVSKLGEHSLNSRQVRAAVQDGIAFLTGEVYSEEDRKRAEEMVHHIAGIHAVNNSIKVAAHSIK